MKEKIYDKIEKDIEINTDEAAWLFKNASDQDLSNLSFKVKKKIHQINDISYTSLAIINHTNICISGCDYCAFYRYPHDKESYILSKNEIKDKIYKFIDLGIKIIGFNGGFNPSLKIDYYLDLFTDINNNFTNKCNFYFMTVAEFIFICKNSKIDYSSAADILYKSGIKWISGGGAEILTDSFRMRHSPAKYTVSEYYKAQEKLLEFNIKSTATMVIGFDESFSERLEHLRLLRNFQNAVNNKLISFLCWTYKPQNTKLSGVEIFNKEYIRWMAVCRIFLNNFKHIRTSVLTQDLYALRALNFGANDFDITIEDEVLQKAGVDISVNFKDILKFAHDLGFNPRLRNGFLV